MSTDEIFGLLADESRPGAPEPTLLPWLTRRVTRAELPVAAAAAAGTVAAPRNRWPVIADAVAAIIAERERDPGRLAGMLDVLPPIAAYVGIEAGAAIDWERAGDFAAGYAVLGGLPPALFRPAQRRRLINSPYWRTIMTVPSLPPLAHIGMLDWLASTPPDERANTDQEAAYLLPFRPGPQARWQALETIETAVGEGSHWYAAALTARAAPWLDQADQGQLREAIAGMPTFWSSYLTRLADGPVTPWASDEDELAASHPAIPRLNDLAAGVDPDELHAIAVALIERTASRHGLDQPWEDITYWLDGASERPQAAVSEVYGLDDEQLRSLGQATPAERHLNAYVAAAGQEEPVPAAPLALAADYVLRCNIGAASRRSLVQGEASVFPDDLLPAGPLELRIVLFLDGRKPVIKPVDLPEAGDSAWTELPLPRVTEPSVLRGDIAVYFGAAIVLMYGLVLPFGGDGARGPEAVPRYRLSRSLADLTKVEGRCLSLAVHGPGTAPAIYVNGLTFAPTALTYDAGEMKKGRFPVLTAFYDAHFSVQEVDGEEGEVSKFSASPGHPFAKPAGELDHDLRLLARDGSQVFGYLFGRDQRARLSRMLRAEAAARGQPPVLQAVALGEQPVPVPWAALYDLPIGSDISRYEPCPSIAEFGPGGNAAKPPVNCPYEDSHRDGDRWKPNQLCPWGFWGLSAIIEHPPSTQARDLETQVRLAAGPPAILVGYDTGLDGKLRKRHLDELEKVHGRNLLIPYADGIDDLEEQLGDDTMDVVYLYCHVIDDPTQPDLQVPAIQFGDGRVTRQDIDLWNDSFWPDPHWPSRHPLVVLNGCGSAKKGPGSLASLVGAFVETAGASGVIGTEIAIEQGLGGWAMELFLSALRDRPVGEALRSTRWEMFSGGNLIGLAYTPYCLAGLTVSPQGEGA